MIYAGTRDSSSSFVYILYILNKCHLCSKQNAVCSFKSLHFQNSDNSTCNYLHNFLKTQTSFTHLVSPKRLFIWQYNLKKKKFISFYGMFPIHFKRFFKYLNNSSHLVSPLHRLYLVPLVHCSCVCPDLLHGTACRDVPGTHAFPVCSDYSSQSHSSSS